MKMIEYNHFICHFIAFSVFFHIISNGSGKHDVPEEV